MTQKTPLELARALGRCAITAEPADSTTLRQAEGALRALCLEYAGQQQKITNAYEAGRAHGADDAAAAHAADDARIRRLLGDALDRIAKTDLVEDDDKGIIGRLRWELGIKPEPEPVVSSSIEPLHPGDAQ